MNISEVLQKSQELWKTQPSLMMLEKKILALGGKKIVYMFEPAVDELLKHGKLLSCKRNRRARHPMLCLSHCHENSCFLWLDRANKGFKIATGWVLNDDGLWRQHSWGLQKNVLIETTCPREKYFGYILDYKQSINFCDTILSLDSHPRSPYYRYRKLVNELKDGKGSKLP